MMPILLLAGLEAYTPDPTKRIVPVKRVQTRQPSLLCIDWETTLTRGLVSVQDARASLDVVCGGGTLYNTASITSSVSAKGVGTNFNQNQIDFPVGPNLSALNEGTILFLGGIQSGTWNVAAINHGMVVRRYNNQLCFGHGVNEIGYGTAAWTGISAFCGAWRGSVEASSAYLDGVKLTHSYSSSGDIAAFSTSTLGGSRSGDRSSATYWAKPCLLSLRWSRALTDSELALVSANPWQVFEPETVLLPVGIAVDPENPPQLLAPISDITQGVWTPSSGSDLYAMIDEEVSDEIDFIVTSAPSLCEMRIAVGADPLIGTGHILRYTIEAPYTLNVRLVQGTTTIASWTHNEIGMTTFEQTLTSEQADSITNYSDLRIQFEVA